MPSVIRSRRECFARIEPRCILSASRNLLSWYGPRWKCGGVSFYQVNYAIKNVKTSFLMQTTRRDFIKAGLGCSLAMSISPTLSMAAGKSKAIPIGFQLYTVRGEFDRDVPGTLKKVAQLGYQAVEFWGYAGTPNVYQKYSAMELRKFLDECGLKCCGMHLDLKALAKENMQQTIESNHTLGSEYLNVAAAKE